MVKGLEVLTDMEYPGRFIILGKSHKSENVAIYVITGRSLSSQARKLVLNQTSYDSGYINLEPTDEDILKKGNPDLLLYNAIMVQKRFICISNGKQTDRILDYCSHNRSAINTLVKALLGFDYEPDPSYTPRISGCMNIDSAALSIIKRAEDGSSFRNYFEVPLINGRGKMISTYTGVNKDPLSSFIGEPLDVGIEWDNPLDAIIAVYESLEPKKDKDDFRVCVGAVYYNLGNEKEDMELDMKIQNRCDLTTVDEKNMGEV
ncbi:MAG: IMP cyclohydrolase [archaeon]